uniref:Flavin-dependent halogenase ChlA n=1 Tax=Acytostelium subglobosum TaxID=361139 RepID=A0A077JG66_ACYSU|nr:flavin-dependent halogenase ChlA [Acytostelium subglobosum]
MDPTDIQSDLKDKLFGARKNCSTPSGSTMEAVGNKHYDVVVIGAGIAGLSAVRHLLLKIPELRANRVAVIDPRSSIRNNLLEDYKVGESTVEISGMFFARELELQDYLIENQPPKFSLQFHWPKKVDKTDSMDDYHSTWAVKNPDIQAFQLNRSKMEKDLLQMVIDQGAVYYHGRVKDVDIGMGDAVKTIDIQMLSEEVNFDDQKPLERINITTDYIADASGRNFIIGTRTDNVLKDPKHLFGLQNASTWLRVKNTDKKYFDFNDQSVTSSWYYATNHFFGPGYWIWMIPIERATHDFSIGVSYHRDKYDPSEFNSLDKFMAFLETNQKVLYNIIKSGEIVDFHRWPRLAHTSKVFVSEDNWCVLGDAAAIFDPFYSTGMVMIAMEVECLTELTKYRLSGDKCATKTRQQAYDKLIRAITQTNCHLIKKHSDHLGNASIMSWRIYLESLSYFGILLPAYIGKYHLCPIFGHEFADNNWRLIEFRDRLLNLMDYIGQQGQNVGFMDNHRGGQLIGSFCPTSSWDYEHCISMCMYGHKRLNLHKYMIWTHFYQMAGVIKMLYRAFGARLLLNGDFQWMMTHTMKTMGFHSVKSWVHYLSNISNPVTDDYYDRNQISFKEYQYTGEAVPWESSM